MKALLLSFALLIPSISTACIKSNDLGDAADSLQVLSPQFHFEPAAKDSRSLLSAIGTAKNTSTACVEDIVVEAKFYGKDKAVVDVITQEVYGLVVGPGKEVSFRVETAPARSQSEYASVELKVVSANFRGDYAYNEEEEDGWLKRALLAVAPIFILFLGFYVIARAMQGKDSYQTRIRVLMERQTEILEQQAESVKKLAEVMAQASENRRGDT